MTNIVVCLHAPPLDAEGRAVGRADALALGHAMSMAATDRSARVTALLAGNAVEIGPLGRALVAGAHRAVRVGGDDFATADFHTVGQVLAAAIRRLGGDLILAGARSDDESLGAVPAATARYLGITYLSGVEEIVSAGDAVEVVVRGGGRKRRLRVRLPAVLAVVAGPPTNPPLPETTGSPASIEVLPLGDPDATVVRRRTELLGRPEPASRGTLQVSSAAALIAALRGR